MVITLNAFTHARLVDLNCRFDIGGVHICEFFHIEEMVEMEGVFRIERDVIHGIDGVLGIFAGFKFHEKVSDGLEVNLSSMEGRTDAPLALPRGIIPWEKDVVW